MTNQLVKEIVGSFGLPEAPKSDRISAARVKEWMKADDIEALGALYTYILDPQYSRRIEPPLSLEDYHLFVLQYYTRCFRENPDGEWSDSRYSAGWSLVNWFKGLWKDNSVPRSALADIKDRLSLLYKEGDEELRTCIINATLEHLFENAEIARYFADWRLDPLLSKAYGEASEWVEKKGAN
jgi:hypothetical protein